ncbi:SnoaL-like domain-containing protein [Olsenella umbonata]|uniref:SnoaL-like domain-containing protein n=1 Tax=Parafannyhessea umbonata TaxID=604330 RepID=A0A7X9T9J6_9ACTN|nr:nuclear transport factor 2 family protein [Parafannyhessea umbonata]NMF25117.1 SnoaL-like domain-containing protein [Parafannyhessea umbonata]
MTNKELVLEFYDKVFNGHDLSDLGRYMREDYRQHSPEVADGREGFRAFAEGFFRLDPHMTIMSVAQDGDRVFVFFRCDFRANGGAAKVCDIYRVEDGMLAEHWDVIQPISADDVFNNGNGHF